MRQSGRVRAKRVLAGLPLVGLAACAVHPLPEGATLFTTVQIVQHIRCEARQAIAEAILRGEDPRRDVTESDVAGFSFGTSASGSSKGGTRLRDRLQDAAIALEFKLTITETNKLSAGLGVGDSFRRGPHHLGPNSGTLSLGTGLDRTRQSDRLFIVATNFDDMFSGPAAPTCKDAQRGANLVHPITGSIGLGEVVETFIALSQTNALKGQTASDASLGRMVDTLIFTTEAKVGADTAKLTLAPIGLKIGLTDVSLVATANRKDIHQVGVSITLPAAVEAAAPGPAGAAPKKRSSTGRKSDALRNAVKGFTDRDFRSIQESLTDIQRNQIGR